MDRAYLHARGVLAVLALHREIEKSFFGHLRRIVVMFGVFKIDKTSSLKSENPDPMQLWLVSGIIVFSYTRVNASSAADAPRKFKTITPEDIGKGFLRADLKFLPVFLRVPLFQLDNDGFLFFTSHFMKMSLEEVFSLLLRARREERDSHPCDGSQGKIAEKLPSRITFLILISHHGFLPDGKAEVQASMA
jgi:hypothetical protein